MAIGNIVLIALLMPLKQLVMPVLGVDFKCLTPGTYPDPEDCRYYHECNDLKKQCGYGYKYSVEKRACVPDTLGSQCYQAQYICINAGDTGTWPGDANIYYTCFNDGGFLYPVLNRCPYGYIWLNGACREGSGSCTSGRLFPSEDCHYYYSCKNGENQQIKCPSGSYFNEKISGCEIGDC